MDDIVEQLSRVGIHPHSNANGIGLWPEEQKTLVWLATRMSFDGQLLLDYDWAEIGTFCGGSACLLNMVENRAGKIHSVDPYPRPIAAVNFKVAKATDVIQHRMRSEDYFLQHHKSELGFVFIDGFHSFAQCLRDFLAVKRFLVPGAIVAFHDVPPKIDFEESLSFAQDNFEQLMNSDIEDFRIAEAIAYILDEFKNFQIETFPQKFKDECKHFQETGLNRWVRGKTSPFNAIAAIRRVS